jgi:hypothetical protein
VDAGVQDVAAARPRGIVEPLERELRRKALAEHERVDASQRGEHLAHAIDDAVEAQRVAGHAVHAGGF